MKTLYFKTNSFVRREGNVIDFTEYRTRMQRPATVPAAVGDDVTFQWEVDDSVWNSEEISIPRIRRPRRRDRQHLSISLANLLELCAAAGTLALVVTVWVQFLI